MTKQPIPHQARYAVEQLKWLRVMLDLNVNDLRMEGSKSFWSDFENLRCEPRISTIVRYCDALGISLDVLLRGCPTSAGVSRLPDDKSLAKHIRKHFGLSRTQIDVLLNSDVRWEAREAIWIGVCFVEEQTDKCDVIGAWLKELVEKVKNWKFTEDGMSYQRPPG